MTSGQDFILEYYRTLNDKIALLDAALEFGDGDLIITVSTVFSTVSPLGGH